MLSDIVRRVSSSQLTQDVRSFGGYNIPIQLKPDSFNYYRNQEFVVDRASGQILGNVIRTEGPQREVRDSGSEHWSYKLIYSFPSREPTLRLTNCTCRQAIPARPSSQSLQSAAACHYVKLAGVKAGRWGSTGKRKNVTEITDEAALRRID
jgi:hypothetical protein